MPPGLIQVGRLGASARLLGTSACLRVRRRLGRLAPRMVPCTPACAVTWSQRTNSDPWGDHHLDLKQLVAEGDNPIS
jgi:hypothetical protein